MNLSTLRSRMFSCFLLTVIVVTAIFVSYSGRKLETGAASTVVSVLPSSANVLRGQTVTVDVNITDVTNLYGYEIKIWYLRAIVNTTAGNVTRPAGHFMEPLDPANQFQVVWQVNNAFNATHGRVWLAFSLLTEDEPSRSGSGILFRINFTGIATGSTPVVLANYPGEAGPVKLVDNTASPIAHTVNGGLITVTTGSAVVSVLPSSANVLRGQTVTVDVNITDVTNLYGYEVKIWYLRAIVNTTAGNVTRPAGHFMEPLDPANQFQVVWQVNNAFNATHGRVWLAFSLLTEDEPSRSGSGILFRINFTGIATGSTPVVLANYPGEAGPVKLVDNTASPIAHTVNGGLITVTTGSAVVSVLPSSANVLREQTVTVDVNITDVTNLFAYEVKIWYLRAIVNTTAGNVTRPAGHFMEPLDPANQFIPKWEVNNAYNATHGRIYVSFTLLLSEAPRSGSGILFRITFTGVATGSTSVVLANYPGFAGPVLLADNTANPISHTTNNGLITVAGAPVIAIISPQNKTYGTKVVPLNFTINQLASWTGYSLDGVDNVTIAGNTTLTGLSEGSHGVRVYANNTIGDMGSSDTVHFEVDTTPPDIMGIVQDPTPDNVLPQSKVKVNATVTDAVSGVKQATLNFTYTNGSGIWNQVVGMTNIEESIWNASIPALPYGTNVTYAIIVEDNVGNKIHSESLGYECKYEVIPEFPSLIILPLFIIATLLAPIVQKRKRRRSLQQLPLTRWRNMEPSQIQTRRNVAVHSHRN